MTELSFAAEFADLVADGRKCQTIRLPRKDGRDPKPGDTLYLKAGPYSGKRRNLGVVKCTSIEPIKIEEAGVTLGCRCRPWWSDFTRRFTLADGFEFSRDMWRYFRRNGGLPFEGYLLKWNPNAKPATGEGQQ